MRTLGMGIAAAALAGCATAGPVSEAAAPTTSSADVVLACLTEELEQLGYQITMLDPTEGQVAAARIEEPAWPLELLGVRSAADRITVSVDADELRVSALAADDVPEPGVVGTGTLTEGQREAERVIAACAD
jgi:hypothetical protein